MQMSDEQSTREDARKGFSRGECKLAGGKLVGVNIRRDGTGAVTQCHLDGDFFLDSVDEREIAALVRDIEDALMAGTPVAEAFARHLDTSIVGIDAAAIEVAFARAVGSTVVDSTVMNSAANKVSGAADVLREDALRDEARRRWQALRPQVIHDIARQPQEQMDIDEQWACEVAAGTRPATLRIWEWANSAVIIGRFQSLEDSVDLAACRREQMSVVRRCTGGGAMFVEPGNTITYSLYAPRDFVRDVSIEQSYRLCDQWLVDALGGIGLDVRFSGLNDIASQYGKIGGAAQRRFPPQSEGPGSLLHHVTMAYDIDTAKMSRMLKVSQEKLRDKAVQSAAKRVDPLRSQTGMSRASVIALLMESARAGLQ
ncbi:lipoate--protein ligase family protein [Bifidobacterium tibiigranuli]|jgi:lipoate-protein ligase A|uniref:lipoate--protein ligase family protein n=1 Tax=Bifidobacterium tibiigranuli TaxID=2172043 RepID=UPI0026EE28F7|nr:lipoate--protein ligase family protein [Bifidobacterium tibiigranuli]MCI1650003.1 lipoate--protein ligase family protein [Bifidobacterium tibiigranuli]MCI2185117.1 lipoate--protein ligase family protein [Bifidobacterium tibiigranuli]MCI2203318.1 lipoate--protein ligase family protein [Bifidobacterium tibiigranuli]